LSGHFRELFERFIHRQIVTTVFKNSGFHFHSSIRSFLFFSVLFCSSTAVADEFQTDTLHTRKLKTVTVNGQRLQVARAAMPVQIISNKEMGLMNANNVSDIAKYFSGVTVKDYGGIGGLKTVSLRGMGAQYTGVSFDGAMMSDIQSGQIDLGRFSLENIERIELSNGQPNDIFQTARTFASGSVLSLVSKSPDFENGRSFEGLVSFKTGSFGLLNPSISLSKLLNKKWQLSLSADATKANGKYNFIQHYGSKASLSEKLTRINADIQSIRTEAKIYYQLRNNEDISLKTNFYGSERGLPDGVTFYNTYSIQRLKDRNIFTQLHYENKVSPVFQQQYYLRYNSAYNRFTETLFEEYLQKEYYASSSYIYNPLQPLFISASADWWYNNLSSDSNSPFKRFNAPTRHSGLANIAIKYLNDRFSISSNLLYTLTRERVDSGVASPDRNKLSPSISMSYKLLSNKELRIRAFYKNIYRLPTFNDLYYKDFGNTNLRPEDAHQWNAGITYLETDIPFIKELAINTDAYYNQVTDKIIAVPKDLFHWTTINKGKVAITGIDLTIKAIFKAFGNDLITLNSNYSYCKALDKTPNSVNYNEQILYTPFHSGSGSINYHHGIVDLAYNMIFSGKRWNGQNITANRLDGYLIHSVQSTFIWNKVKLSGELINIFNTQYEVVQFYPMPRQNFRVTVNVTI